MNTRLQDLKLLRKEIINDIILYKCKNPHYNVYLHIDKLESQLRLINEEINKEEK